MPPVITTSICDGQSTDSQLRRLGRRRPHVCGGSTAPQLTRVREVTARLSGVPAESRVTAPLPVQDHQWRGAGTTTGIRQRSLKDATCMGDPEPRHSDLTAAWHGPSSARTRAQTHFAPVSDVETEDMGTTTVSIKHLNLPRGIYGAPTDTSVDYQDSVRTLSLPCPQGLTSNSNN